MAQITPTSAGSTAASGSGSGGGGAWTGVVESGLNLIGTIVSGSQALAAARLNALLMSQEEYKSFYGDYKPYRDYTGIIIILVLGALATVLLFAVFKTRKS